MKIRAGMKENNGDLLSGIVEADECYIGGKPRKGNKRDDDTPNPRGRGTKKMPIIGIAERGGRVVSEVADKVNGKAISEFINRNVSLADSLLMTDEFKGYNTMTGQMPHAVINHSYSYSDGLTHTNTIEGFWATVKRAWFGQHYHYTRKFAPAYITEACYKYNNRHIKDGFNAFITGAILND